MYRYFCAGILSLAIHFLILAPILEQPVMALPMTQQTQSVSISFATVAKPEPEKVAIPEPVKTEPTPPVVKTPKKKPTPTTQKQRIVKEKVVKETPKKEISKPIKKVEKKQPKVKKTLAKPVTKPIQPKQTAPQPVTPAKAVTPEMPVSKVEKIADKKQVVKQTNGLQDKPQLIEKSRFLSKPTPPKYPRIAKRKGLEGTVTYEVWLDEKGKQVKLLLKNSSGAKVLDVAALKAIKSWEFSPHSINGKQIAHRIYIPISFQLD